MKIALGTVRFGMDYGISNERDQIPYEEAADIFTAATRHGVDVIDTAYNYGESESVLGSLLKDTAHRFKVVSKLPKCGHGDVPRLFKESLEKLNVCRLYGYIIHNFDSYVEDEAIWDELCKLKSSGQVEKIGFSIYYPQELERLFDKKVNFNIIQIPLSILDQRFMPYLECLKKLGVEIHVRSVFLQGLFFKDADKLSGSFKKISSKLKELEDLSCRESIPLYAICLLFAVLNENVDKVVIGMGSVKHVESDIGAFRYAPTARKIYDRLLSLREDDENIVVPSMWECKKLYRIL
ncbi:MAG: aldo/keto reductase [Parcubacteria group bacterium]|nr:aldo/keto reductase [Parcubacteria group bacterium]